MNSIIFVVEVAAPIIVLWIIILWVLNFVTRTDRKIKEEKPEKI